MVTPATTSEVTMDAGGSPAWVPCPCCEEFLCTIRRCHAHECDCPPIEEWEVDPYTSGGSPLDLAADSGLED